jgi:hypothetical protein
MRSTNRSKTAFSAGLTIFALTYGISALRDLYGGASDLQDGEEGK